ncbi:MAG: hypothetical protein AAF541_22745 [Pseudomonadota bacterium]
MKVVLGFVAAVVVAYLFAVLFYSQINLANLVEFGIEVDMGLRIQTLLHDLAGMTAIYLPVLVVAFLIGFLIAKLILRWVPQLRTLGYITAGFVAIFAIDALLGLVFGMHPLAVTRSMVGLLSQCVAGAIGGYVFAKITAPHPEKFYLSH